MDYAAIRDEVQEILRDVADNPSIVLTDESKADEVEGWDSIAHIQLLVAAEQKFNISFSSDEIGGYNNIGEMCKGIEKNWRDNFTQKEYHMPVSFNIFKTTELTPVQFSSVLKNFNTVFEKNLPAEELKRNYLNTREGYSYHALMEEGDYVAGYFSAVPFVYSCFGEKRTFCYIGGLFIMPEYRKDPLALYKLYTTAKKYLKERGISLLMAVPNDNAYPYFKHALKWHEVSTLNYHALPVRFGNISRHKKFLNIFSVPLTYLLLFVQNICSILINQDEQRPGIFLLPDPATAEAQRYSGQHTKIRKPDFSVFYKIESEAGILTAYLIDYYNSSGIRDARSLYKSLNYIVKNEQPDLVLFIGSLHMKHIIPFRVPVKKEPRSLHFCIEILDKEKISEKAYDKNNWNFGLYNFDVR